MPAAEIEYPVLVMPETVERTTVKIWSNGVALDADLYRPKGLAEEQRLPAVVLSHGWGGSKSTGERYAAKFAAAGMVCLCFSYSGWSSSGSHVVLTGDPPDVDECNEGIAAVRVIREVFDPVEWLQNFRSAVGGRACEILKLAAAAPVDYRIIDGIDHYGIYFDGYDESSDAALAWFTRHL